MNALGYLVCDDTSIFTLALKARIPLQPLKDKDIGILGAFKRLNNGTLFKLSDTNKNQMLIYLCARKVDQSDN